MKSKPLPLNYKDKIEDHINAICNQVEKLYPFMTELQSGGVHIETERFHILIKSKAQLAKEEEAKKNKKRG